MVAGALTRAIDTCDEYAAEYRILLPDGTLRWISARGRAIAGPDGRAERLLGAALDTTTSRDAEARVSRVLESMPTAFFQLDQDWRFTFLNAEAERLLGRTRGELVCREVWTEFPAALDSDFETHYRGAMATGRPVAFDAYYPEPLDAWYEVRAWPTEDGLSVYFVDVTARHRAQEQLALAGRRDALLADAAAAMAGTLDLDEALSRLTEVLVPAVADWCVATAVESRGTRAQGLRDVAARHRDAAYQPILERWARIRLAALDQEWFLPMVLDSSSRLATSGAREVLSGLFEPGEARTLLEELDPEHVTVVALHGRDRPLAVVTLLRGRERPAFSEDDLALLAEIAQRSGLALDNTRLFAEQRGLAEGLQRHLLTPPPQPPGVHLTARYEAAAETAQVGGDWYDAFVQPDGGTVLVVGDVVGHDTAAAAAMGQVRNLLRGAAALGVDGPAAILAAVDRTLDVLALDTTATAVVARLDPAAADGRRRLRWSSAGHPAPVVLHPDGRVELLAATSCDLLLGLDVSAAREEHEVALPEGCTLLLYTDGLVERRGEDIDQGLHRLVDAAGRLGTLALPLDDFCDRIVEELVPHRREDDLALLGMRLHATEPLTHRLRLAAAAASVADAREFLRTVVPPSACRDEAALCLSELATNAVLHSASDTFEVLLTDLGGGPGGGSSNGGTGGGLRVAVRDDGTGDLPITPTPSTPDAVDGLDGMAGLDELAEGGRGLAIVEALASRWGITPLPDGREIWAVLKG